MKDLLPLIIVKSSSAGIKAGVDGHPLANRFRKLRTVVIRHTGVLKVKSRHVTCTNLFERQSKHTKQSTFFLKKILKI